MLLETLAASILENALTGKGVIRTDQNVTNFEIQTYYESQSKFNGVYSRNNSSKIRDGPYKISLDEYESIGTHWITLYVNAENVTYFDNFGVENIPKEIRKFIGNKSIITNIHRIQAYDLIMCGYFSIAFIDFMLKDKSLLEYTNSFSPNKYKKNDKVILKYFQ